MSSYKMFCMDSFAERLNWAMRCAGFDPARDQSRVAALIGKPCKPQNIQHLLDPESSVENSKYTLDLAMVLDCDPFWLGRNKGTKPAMKAGGDGVTPLRYPTATDNVAVLAASPAPRQYAWPFKSFTPEEFGELDEGLRDNFEAIIHASIKARASPEKKPTPATNTAKG